MTWSPPRFRNASGLATAINPKARRTFGATNHALQRRRAKQRSCNVPGHCNCCYSVGSNTTRPLITLIQLRAILQVVRAPDLSHKRKCKFAIITS